MCRTKQKEKDMRRFILRLSVMMVAFVLGVGANALVDRGLGSVVERWTDDPKSFLGQLSITLLAEEPRFNPRLNYCGLLVVGITNDRNLYLNRQEMGSLDDPSELVAKLNEIFRHRTELRLYRDGLDLNSATPDDERIEKTVFIKASRGLSYGEVSDLIGVVKGTGANPIGLVTERTSYTISH
jgi:biopolymer transport protein ExbD